MGSFMGHILPGSFFLAFGLWYMYSMLKRYHLCRRAEAQIDGGGNLYKNTATFPCPCFSRLPTEGLMKITATIIGFTGEFVTAFKHGKFAHYNNLQHMTMFFFFGLNGIIDVMTHYRAPIPHGLDYISGVLAFCMEFILFFYHLHGRSPMDIQVHMLLLWVVAGCIFATLAEMYFRRSVMPALTRSYFIILQGSWFIQAGFILYPPFGQKWDEENHNQMMTVTAIFCWHCGAAFLLMLATGWIIHTRVKKLSQTSVYHSLRPIGSTPETIRRFTKMDSEHIQRIIDDSEEDEV